MFWEKEQSGSKARTATLSLMAPVWLGLQGGHAVSNSEDLFDVTIAPPAAGPAPMPPSELREVFATLAVIQTDPRAWQDRLRTGLGAAMHLAGAVPGCRVSLPAH
jgi:hypothetical protein